MTDPRNAQPGSYWTSGHGAEAGDESRVAAKSGRASVRPNRPGAASPAGWFPPPAGEAAPPVRLREPARSDGASPYDVETRPTSMYRVPWQSARAGQDPAARSAETAAPERPVRSADRARRRLRFPGDASGPPGGHARHALAVAHPAGTAAHSRGRPDRGAARPGRRPRGGRAARRGPRPARPRAAVRLAARPARMAGLRRQLGGTGAGAAGLPGTRSRCPRGSRPPRGGRRLPGR